MLKNRITVSCLAFALATGLGLLGVVDARAAEVASADGAAGAGLPGLGQPDTLRSNLWLTEALMAEIVTQSAKEMPPPPRSVLLVAEDQADADLIFGTVATALLSDLGYEVFRKVSEDTVGPGIDYVYTYRVENVGLSYPDVGRTLGIWRRWVARDLTVAALVEIAEADSGRLLLNDRIERRYTDRIEDGDFGRVDSDVYPFTTAETSESGWQRRAEEIVVLGTLVGLIAVYFANTGN